MRTWTLGDEHECGQCATSHIATAGCVAYAIEQGDPRYRDGLEEQMVEHDMVNHPSHYVSHPSGIECIQVTEHLNFCIWNAVKYLWRADDKGDPIENLRKAAWYIEREIKRRESTT